MENEVICPRSDAGLDDILEFALTYDAYTRLAGSPETLAPIVGPVVDSLEAGDDVPPWAGLDLLRGALFYLQRRTYHWGEVPSDQEAHMRTLTAAIQRRCVGRALSSDRAPNP